MTKTLSEVVAEAHRRIRVLSVDEDPSPDMVTYGEAAAASLFAELNAAPHSMGLTWTLETVPEAAFRPLAWLLATDLGIHYAEATESRARALTRMRAYALPDDREDVRDLDEDGAISEAEADIAKQAEFY